MRLQNPNVSLDFVHGQRVETGPASLKLVAFPDAFRCYTHTSMEETEFIYNEVFVKQDYLRHGLTLKDAACIIDIGANIGIFTLFAKIRNPRAVVHAFEPIQDSFNILKLNVQSQRLADVHLLADHVEDVVLPDIGNSIAYRLVLPVPIAIIADHVPDQLDDCHVRRNARHGCTVQPRLITDFAMDYE